MSEETDQLDVFTFLSDGPKIIQEFRDSKLFYVEAYGRGVYPRSILSMLEDASDDLKLVKSFQPYKATKEEIEEFSKELNGISEERRKILTRYVSWRLTKLGENVVKESEAMRVEIEPDEEESAESEAIIDNLIESIDEKETSEDPPKPLFKTLDVKIVEELEKTKPITQIEPKELHLEKPIVPEPKEMQLEDDEDIKDLTIEEEREKEIAKSVDQNITELAMIEERDASEIVEEEIATKQSKIDTLNEELDKLGVFDRSRKKEIKKDIEILEKEIEELKKKL